MHYIAFHSSDDDDPERRRRKRRSYHRYLIYHTVVSPSRETDTHVTLDGWILYI